MGLVELATTPVTSFKPLVLTDPGKVIRVRSRAFVAGAVPAHVRVDCLELSVSVCVCACAVRVCLRAHKDTETICSNCHKVAERMNKEAKRVCRKYFGDEVDMQFENVQETRHTAYGEGTGIMYVPTDAKDS